MRLRAFRHIALSTIGLVLTLTGARADLYLRLLPAAVSGPETGLAVDQTSDVKISAPGGTEATVDTPPGKDHRRSESMDEQGAAVVTGPGRSKSAAEFEVRDNLDIFVTQGRALLTGKGRTGEVYSLWFDENNGTFRVLDATRQAYFEVLPEYFKRVEIDRRRRQTNLEARLKTRPPEQHAKLIEFVEQLEQRLYGGAPPVLPEHRSLNATDRIGPYPCMRWQVVRDETIIRELCVATQAALKVGDEDWAVLQAMHRVGSAIAGSSGLGARLIPRFVLDLGEGIPIQIKYLEPVLTEKVLVLQSMSRTPIEPATVLSYGKYRKMPLPTVSY